MTVKINLVMITKNEESKLERCLSSVKDLVDEIIIVDTGSTDATKNIASKFNALVYDYKWDDNFSNARNFGLERSNADWNLILDADEYVHSIDLESLYNILSSNSESVGQIKIINYFEQDNEVRKSIDFIARLAPKKTYFKGSVHEQIDSNIPRIKVPITIEHDGYLNTNKFDRNIQLLLNELNTNENDLYLLYQTAKTYYSNKMYIDASYYFDKFYDNITNYNSNYIYDGIILYLYNLIKVQNFDKGLYVIDNVFDYMNNYCDFHFICGLFLTESVAYNTNKYINHFSNIDNCYLNALYLGESNGFEIVEGTGSYLAAFNLGLFYELSKNHSLSLKYYNLSASYNYMPAINKLKQLKF